MTSEALETQDESRISRRNALKAAVGVGVGAVAWSGPQITAFGATPAYAEACTFAVFFELTPDRNTDQTTNCTYWRYHELRVPDEFRDRFTLTPEIPGDPGVCSDEAPPFKLCYDADENLDCFVRVLIYNQNGQGGVNADGIVYDEVTGETTPSDADPECIDFTLPSGLGLDYNSSARYSITVSCVTEGKQACFPDLPGET